MTMLNSIDEDSVFQFELNDDTFTSNPLKLTEENDSKYQPIVQAIKPREIKTFPDLSKYSCSAPISSSSSSHSSDEDEINTVVQQFVYKTQEQLAKSVPDSMYRRQSHIVELREFEDRNLESEVIIPKKYGVDDSELLRVIGRGAYGKVFMVRKTVTGNIYAMKVLKKASIVLHEKTTEHTINERQILSQIEHPFIVKLHYAFQTSSRLYLILGYAQGGELFTYMKKERMFSEDVARFYIAELLLALEHLHDLGIIYRDLKPENVLLDRDGHVLLTDFGLSKVALDGTLTVCGTAEFMAPEVIEEQRYDRCVDYWSLGVMLYDMLTGAPPFTSGNRKKVLENILRKKPVFPRHITQNARDLLTKLLKKNPSVRLGSDSTGGVRAIKKHAFFKNVVWDSLESKECDPPIVPNLSGWDDTSCFDNEFTSLPVTLHDDAVLTNPDSAPAKKKKKNKCGFADDSSQSPECKMSLLANAVALTKFDPKTPVKADKIILDEEVTLVSNLDPMVIPNARKMRSGSSGMIGSIGGSALSPSQADLFKGFSFVAATDFDRWIH